MQTILLISCPDQPGIVARFTGILYEANANVLSLEQHVEENKWFFMRIYADLGPESDLQRELQTKLQALGQELQAAIEVHDPQKLLRIAILASTEQACPRELLISHQSGQLQAKITNLISNHTTMEGLAKSYEIPFNYVDSTFSMEAAEDSMMKILQHSRPDLVVLARYMKVLSPAFVAAYENRIINIHHGFLPAFKGSRPYHQAWERGVKVIGATAHYVTADLDDGPIIAQEVIPVTHQHSVEDMVQAGQDIEKRVLVRAVQAFLQHKIILHNHRTILFH
jgi:formyltetrahydrofolate deformylase